MREQREPLVRRAARIMGRAALGLLCGVLALALLAAGAVWGLWHNEIRALLSFEQVRGRDYGQRDGAVYRMHVPGGFYLEEFLEQGGAKSDDELIAFITGKITKGLVPMEIRSARLGCSSFTAQTADGDKLFARNYDMKETNVCIVTTDGGRGRHATISTIDLQFLGVNRYLDADGLTVHSAVYNMTDRTVLWVSNEHYDDETAVFTLGFD